MVLANCLNPDDVNVNQVSMKLNGILDAAVMGGVANYEKVCTYKHVNCVLNFCRFGILIFWHFWFVGFSHSRVLTA